MEEHSPQDVFHVLLKTTVVSGEGGGQQTDPRRQLWTAAEDSPALLATRRTLRGDCPAPEHCRRKAEAVERDH